jgi:glycosyltransferase involved in cell wall biosynthesis
VIKNLSIIVPAYNSEKFINAALDSIFRQSITPLEILVVDNLSTDKTAELARLYDSPVQVLSCEHQGVSFARNHALSRAKGEWISFLDADDIWADNTLELFFSTIEKDQSLDCVYGCIQNFREHIDTTGGYFSENPLPAPMPGATMISRSALNTIGSFSETYTMGSVIEWGFRVAEANIQKMALSDVVLHRRIHDTNLCKINKDDKNVYARIVKAALVRRRNTANKS